MRSCASIARYGLFIWGELISKRIPFMTLAGVIQECTVMGINSLTAVSTV